MSKARQQYSSGGFSQSNAPNIPPQPMLGINPRNGMSSLGGFGWGGSLKPPAPAAVPPPAAAAPPPPRHFAPAPEPQGAFSPPTQPQGVPFQGGVPGQAQGQPFQSSLQQYLANLRGGNVRPQ